MGEEGATTVTVETDDAATDDAPDVVVVDTSDDGASEIDVEQAERIGNHEARIAQLESDVAYCRGMIDLAVEQAERATDIAIDAEVTAINASVDAAEASETSEQAAEDAEEAAEDAEEASDEIEPDGREHWFYKPLGRKASA